MAPGCSLPSHDDTEEPRSPIDSVLIQLWLASTDEEETTTLETRGAPYTMVGSGDAVRAYAVRESCQFFFAMEYVLIGS